MQTQSPNIGSPGSDHLPRILVIDDESAFTRLMKLNLEATGRYLVRTETNPQQALEAANSFRPDLVLLDVMMPVIDGGDIANQLGQHPLLKKIPVIFLTATVKHVEVNANNGCIGGLKFLSKPVVLSDLLECLDNHFSGRRTSIWAHA